MEQHNYVFSKLAKDCYAKSFCCSDKDLTNFLLEDAKNYQNDLMAVTYLYETPELTETVAYFSLLNDKLSYNPTERSIWNRLNRLVANKKRRRNYPAVKIGRLAVNEKFTGCHVGQQLIDTIITMFIVDNKTGCRFITVDAYANATGFYQKCGFEFFSDRDKGDSTRLMFMDLKPYKEELERTLAQFHSGVG